MALAALAVMAVVIPIISAELPTEGPNYDLNQQVAWGNWFRANNPNQTQNNPTGHNANYPGAILATFRLSGVIYETDTCASCHSGTYGGGQLNNYGMAFAQNPEHAANPVKVLQSLGAPPGFVDIAQAVNNPNCQQVWYSSPLYPQYVCSGQPNSAQQGQQITQQQQQQL